MRKVMTIIVSIVTVVIVGCIIRVFFVPPTSQCIYRYIYFTDDDSGTDISKVDIVDVASDDAQELRRIINKMKIYLPQDELTGLTDDYSITFGGMAQGPKYRIQLLNTGVLQFGGLPVLMRLEGNDYDMFFSILSKYHRFPGVARAG